VDVPVPYNYTRVCGRPAVPYNYTRVCGRPGRVGALFFMVNATSNGDITPCMPPWERCSPAPWESPMVRASVPDAVTTPAPASVWSWQRPRARVKSSQRPWQRLCALTSLDEEYGTSKML